ncbi:MAG: hypothetical protein IPI67_05595 [Myxococcales bacterium]|nr:hypothetical protein [Myxococcales bacterium]
MLNSVRGTASVGSMFLFLLLLCCKRSEPTLETSPPAPPPAPAQPTGDSCGAQGTWRFSCPSVKADTSCNIRSIGAISQSFTIPQEYAEAGGTWTVGENKYTLDRTTCELSGYTSGMPCRDLHFEANLRTKSGRNVYGCWDGAKKCQATWSSPPGHCSVTKE